MLIIVYFPVIISCCGPQILSSLKIIINNGKIKTGAGGQGVPVPLHYLHGLVSEAGEFDVCCPSGEPLTTPRSTEGFVSGKKSKYPGQFTHPFPRQFLNNDGVVKPALELVPTWRPMRQLKVLLRPR